MKTSTHRILTTHTGSLPRPPELLELYARPGSPDLGDLLSASVAAFVRQQVETGLDIINDGEFGKPTSTTEDADHAHGGWAMYVRERLSGLEVVDTVKPVQRSKDRAAFASFYGEARRRQPAEPERAGEAGGMAKVLTCTGPVEYCGDEIVGRDIRNLGAALDQQASGDAFLPVVSPESIVSLIPNEYYPDDDALPPGARGGAAPRVPGHRRSRVHPPGRRPCPRRSLGLVADESRESYRAAAAKQVELMNHALRGIPEDQIRYHLCWGSWEGPHRSDLPLADIVDLMLTVRAGAYLIEAANPRHEHEWKLWRDVHLPDGKILIPGVVTHKTSVVEHPDVIADRILRYAEVIGRERVIAGTDCGLGGRISSDVAWSKLESLVEGARRATKRLWT